MIGELASSIASFAIVSIAYAALIGRMRSTAPRYRQIAVGAILGAGALLCAIARRHMGAMLPISDAMVLVGLAQPFGGGLATIVAGAIAAVSLLAVGGGSSYPGLAEIPVAACVGFAVTEALRRQRPSFGLGELTVLALCLTLAAAALLAPIRAFRELPAEAVVALSGRILLGTMVLGTLLQRWGEAEWRIHESERRRRALVANVPGTVMQITVNPAGELSFAFDTSEPARIFDGALGAAPDTKKVLQAIHPDDRAAFRRSLVEAGRSLSPWSHEFRVVLSGGNQRWLRGRAMPTLTVTGDIVWDAIVVNVTSRRDVEQVLRRSEALQRLLAENTTEILASIGPQQTWVYVSPSARDILGREPDEMIGRSWLSLVDDADITRVKDAMTGLVPGGPPVTLSYRAKLGGGKVRWVEETRRLVAKANADEPPEGVSVIRPTEPPRPAAPRVVLEREPGRAQGGGQFARMLEAASAGIVVMDPHQADHPVIFANEAATTLTGYSRDELIGRNWRLLQGSDADPAAATEIEDAMRQQRPLSTSLIGRRKDGSSYWARLDFSPVRDEAGQVDAYVGIFADISEQKRIEDDLRRARDAAEEANQAKSEFIANISHELRTPLNGVIGFTNLLLNENLPAEQRRYASFAHDAGSSLLAIINNILDLSKIEAGKLALIETDFSVVELAVSCNTVVWHAARERGLDLNFVLKPDVMNLVRGDPNRIRQVLLNLLSNAVKYTEKGSIVLTIAKFRDLPNGTALKFSVTDTGVGIAKEQQSRLFQKFSQIEDKPGIYVRGTGLGLAICKNLVEQMGGTIGVTSMPGLGSNFWFTIPLKPAANDGIVAGMRAGGAARRGVRILLVEDTVMNQELMITLLRRAGHEVEVAGDGEAAVEAVQRRAFDIILMDVQLPRMDGLAATRAIRGLAATASDVPIIAMTARALAGDVEKCLAAGMNDHLSKPVDAAALLAIIDRWARPPHAEPETEAPEEWSSPPVQDREALRDIESHIGRRKLDDLLARAREELPRRLRRMNDARSDRPLVEQEAHELVSVAGAAGLLELVERARAVMEACQQGGVSELATTLAALNAAGDRALAVLDAGQRAGAG